MFAEFIGLFIYRYKPYIHECVCVCKNDTKIPCTIFSTFEMLSVERDWIFVERFSIFLYSGQKASLILRTKDSLDFKEKK